MLRVHGHSAIVRMVLDDSDEQVRCDAPSGEGAAVRARYHHAQPALTTSALLHFHCLAQQALEIRVRGIFPANLLHALVESVQVQSNTFVSAPQKFERGQPRDLVDPFPIPLDALKALVQSGANSVSCPGQGVVPIASVLLGCSDRPAAGACLLRAMRAGESYQESTLRALRHMWRQSTAEDPIRPNLAQLLRRRARRSGMCCQ